MRLENKVTIITGGSRGIGYATAEAFLREGAKVIITASSIESVTKAVNKLKKDFPASVIEGIAPNLNNYEEVKEEFDNIVSKYGSIDVLINNAGVSENTSFEDYTEDIFNRVMDINLRAVYATTKAAVNHMLKKESGVVLSTSSMVSKYGQPKGVAYPTSKAALRGFTISLARELGPKGIRVNAVAPGIIETDMMKAVPKEVIEPMIDTIPARRLGRPEDIANAFVFLASEEAAYITGVILSVDGMAKV